MEVPVGETRMERGEKFVSLLFWLVAEGGVAERSCLGVLLGMAERLLPRGVKLLMLRLNVFREGITG